MRLILLLLPLITILPLQGRQKYIESSHYANGIYNEKIKTVQLYKEGWNLSYPIIKLNSDEKLVLHFDLLDDQAETYYYTFVHCNKEWEKSDIFINDYLEGFPENPIEDYESSFNTTTGYYHYKLLFPNNNVSLSLSGNYALVVYPVHKPEEPVIIQRFIITEDAAKIDVSAHRPQMTEENNTHQQIDFSVNYTGLNILDPYRNIYAFILQNGRWDNAKKDLKPEFSGINELKYSSLSDKNIFMGGNEYRYFDIRSLRYLAENIKEIEYVSPYYNVFLTTSESREFKPYFYYQDFNGKYYIAVQEGRDNNTDADYVYVYFTLTSSQPVPGGDVYVSGDLNNWALNSNNKMTYNMARGEYECSMFLKQGWYNYKYVFLENNSSVANSSLFEGSHYETENDYIVLIYYRNPLDRYDRVIGSVIANTLNRMTR